MADRCHNISCHLKIKYSHDIDHQNRKQYIQNDIRLAVNEVFGHEWGDLQIIFTSNTVTSENYWWTTWQVNKNEQKLVIRGKPYITLFFKWSDGC